MVETQLDRLYKLIETVYEDLDKVKEMISKLQLEARKEALKDVPGVEGVFDGKYLITDNHENLEVPANYAAKSRIVYGDRLKAYEDAGKQVFKQLEKVSRKKIEGIVSKKEGKFFALTETGSYEISSTAVEFNKVNVNDKIQVIIPEDNPHAPYAALDKIIEQKGVAITESNGKPTQEAPKVEKKPISKDVALISDSKDVVKEENKEFVMDLSAHKSSVEQDLPIMVTTPASISEPLAPVAPKAASIAPEIASSKPSENVQNAPRRDNRDTRDRRESRGGSSSKRKRPSKGVTQSDGQARTNNVPKYPNKPSARPEYDNKPQRPAASSAPQEQTTTLRPFALEDDDLR